MITCHCRALATPPRARERVATACSSCYALKSRVDQLRFWGGGKQKTKQRGSGYDWACSRLGWLVQSWRHLSRLEVASWPVSELSSSSLDQEYPWLIFSVCFGI